MGMLDTSDITHPSQLFEPESLTSQAKRRAALAIENTRKAYEELEAVEQKCSSYIFGLAQFAVETCPKKKQPAELFGALCAYAEAQYKERFNVVNLKEALPVWSVYKSNIMAGMRLGLNPMDYSTEWEFRKATAEKRKPTLVQSNEVTQGSVTRLPALPMRPVRFEQAEKAVLGLMIRSSSLQQLLTRLLVEAEYVKKGKEDEAEQILTEAVTRLSTLIDQRRIKREARAG